MALFLLAALGNSAEAIEVAITGALPLDRFYRIEPGRWIIDSDAITAKDASLELDPSICTTSPAREAAYTKFNAYAQ